MKRFGIFMGIILMLLSLCACETQEEVVYAQRLLPEPESIKVVSGNSNKITYEKTDANFEKLYAAFQTNWWKMMGEDGLTEVSSLKSIKTTANRTYLEAGGTIVYFLYPDAISWTLDNGSTLDIRLIAFILPDSTAAEGPVAGEFTVAKEILGNNEGLYTYYYPQEIAGGFWKFLMH